MFKVKNRNGSVFGNEPYICEFICDTTSDVPTLPTSISEGTGGKTKYDNQLCSSGSIATVIDNGSDPKKYILNNQNTWCPYSISEGSSIAITVDSSLSDVSKNPVENKVVTAAIDSKADKTDIPTKMSQLENDSGFLSEHQDLSAYAKTDDLNTAVSSINTALADAKEYTDIAVKGGETLSGSTTYFVDNSVDYPLVGLNLYGKSVQDGIPTPDNPVDIVSVGDSGSVEVQTCGKNLFPWNDYTKAPIGNWGLSTGCHVYVSSGEIKVEVGPDTHGSGGGACIFGENYSQVVTPHYWKTLTISYELKADDEITVRHGWEKAGVHVDSAVSTTWQKFSCTRVYKDICNICWKTINQPETNLYIRNIQIELGDTATAYEPYKSTSANITTALPLYGIPVSEGGNYTDSNGQQWACDELVYNADGTGKIIKRTAKIESYNGEEITTPYISTTGDLTTGATVIYQTDAPQEISLTAADVSALMQLWTYSGVTNISNSGNADMDVKYCTDKSLSECVMPITMGLQKQIDELQVYMQKQIDELQASILSPGPLTIPGFFAETIIGPIITEGDE